MRSWEERREEQRRYESDVGYDVWRAGGNPDRINADRVSDAFYEAKPHEEAARIELAKRWQARESDCQEDIEQEG